MVLKIKNMKVFLWELLVYEVIIPSTSEVTRSPYGPRLCLEICQTLGRCSNPLFREDHLLCVLENETKDEGLRELGYKQTTSCLGTSGPGMQLFVSRSGRNVCLPAGIRTKRKSKKGDSRRLLKNEKFNLKIPSTVDRMCRVLSMTGSKLHDGFIYLLLHCNTLQPCFIILAMLDMSVKEVLRQTWFLCEKEEDKRQLFTGPCVEKNGRCLYSFNYSYDLRITTYREPGLKQKEMKRDIRTFKTKLSSFESICASSRSNELFCLTTKSLKCIDIIKNNRFKGYDIIIKRSYLIVTDFTNVVDFAIATDLYKNFLVHIDRIVHRTFTSDMKKVVDKWSVNIRAFSTLLHDGYVLLGSRHLQDSFYLCSQDTFKNCLESFT